MEDSYITQALDILNRLHEFDEAPGIKMLTAIKHLNALGHLNLEATLGILFPMCPQMIFVIPWHCLYRGTWSPYKPTYPER